MTTPTLINLTPHALTLRGTEGDTVIPPSGTVARVGTLPGALQDLGLPVPVASPDATGEVTGVPDPTPGVFLIVSGFVGQALAGRQDILVPGTSPADGPVRNEKGHIVAVTRLKQP